MGEPTLPTAEEIATLPRWARVAFAARCARFALPLYVEYWPTAPQNHVEAVRRAVEFVEGAATVAEFDTTRLNGTLDALVEARRESAVVAYHTGCARHATSYAAWVVEAALQVAAIPAPADVARVAEILDRAYDVIARRETIWEAFEQILYAARQGNWTDDTPVPQSVFEPDTPETFLPWNAALAELSSEPLAGEWEQEELAMRERYPGEYVAYRETDGELRREVVAHDPSLKNVLAAFSHLPPRERELVEVTYFDSPEQRKVFRGGYDNEMRPGNSHPLGND